jgi:hypothetical protein
MNMMRIAYNFFFYFSVHILAKHKYIKINSENIIKKLLLGKCLLREELRLKARIYRANTIGQSIY